MNEDPIAAHLTELIADAPAPNHEEDDYDAGYVAALADLRDSAAFKLVVEQHTNGRIAELYEQRDNAVEAGLAAIDRAEQAEAMIARVRAVEAEYLDPEDTDIECREDVWRFIRDLRAALEGKQVQVPADAFWRSDGYPELRTFTDIPAAYVTYVATT